MNFQSIGFKVVVATAVLTGVMSVSASARAFSIGDTLQFSSMVGVDYDVDGTTPDSLNFGNNVFDPSGVAANSQGVIQVNSSSTGSFASYIGKSGTIKDLGLNPASPTPVTNFLKISPDLSFDLTSFNYGVVSFPGAFDIFGNGVSGVFKNASGQAVAEGLITAQIIDGTTKGLSSYSGTITVTKPTAVPTPALLPGLIGLGVAALRKRKQEKVKAQV